MKTEKKISAVLLIFSILCSALFVITANGGMPAMATEDPTGIVVLQQDFEDGESWEYVEGTFTAIGSKPVILYMQPSDYNYLIGTTVYVDDIVIKETGTDTVALNLPFEALGSGKRDTVYYETHC